MLLHSLEEDEKYTLDIGRARLFLHPSPAGGLEVFDLNAADVERWISRMTDNPTHWRGIPRYSDGTSLYESEEEYLLIVFGQDAVKERLQHTCLSCGTQIVQEVAIRIGEWMHVSCDRCPHPTTMKGEVMIAGDFVEIPWSAAPIPKEQTDALMNRMGAGGFHQMLNPVTRITAFTRQNRT